MACFIFVVSGDGSCHRPESRSASVGERRCDMSLGSWLKILHLATNTATSFLQIGSHNFSYMCLWVLVAGARYGERHTSPYRALRPWLYLSLNRHSYCFMFGRCFILAMLLSCPGGGLNVYLFTLAWCDLYWLEHWQVKTLCEKAKEILMEESNVQVWHAGNSPLTVGVRIFSYR